jgi:hypothetical protein
MLVWWRGDIYVNMFLCGVDGVMELGIGMFAALLGGVCERVGSLIVVECEVVSGDRFGGVGCGICESYISPLNSVENVRFASSAIKLSANHRHVVEVLIGSLL